jgi:peptide/nickel transport system substrate-binding protein
VKFHDGTGFNADAVKYNFDKLIASGRASANLLGCDVVDPYTVKINFAEGMNINFGSAAGLIIASPTFVEANGDTYAANPCLGKHGYRRP